MTSKNLVVLAGVAVVLGVAAYVSGSGSRNTAPKLNGKAIFPALGVDKIAKVEFGNELKLVASDDGWKLETYFGYPASRERIVENLMKLAELKVGQVARGKTLEKTTDLTLRDAAGGELAKLALGERHEKWGRGRYAKFEGEAVLVSDDLEAFDKDPKRWIETKIVDEPWISFNEVQDPKADAAIYGFETGVVAKVKIGTDTNRTVTVGAVVKGGSDRYLKINDAPWVYTVSSYSVESLLPKKEEPKKEAPAKEVKAAAPSTEPAKEVKAAAPSTEPAKEVKAAAPSTEPAKK